MDARQMLFAKPDIAMKRRGDGTVLLRSRIEPGPPARSTGVWLERWGRQTPERLFLAERPAPGAPWATLTYGEALDKVRAAASWLLAAGLSPERPLAILSDNSVEHAILALGAMHAGIPAATVSPAYSLMSSDHQRLRAMIALLTPGAIYVADKERFGAALAAIADVHDAAIVAGSGDNALPFAEVVAGCDAAAVDAAHAATGPDTIARLLFTSGSTGVPKAVINTHRMLTSNQEAKAAIWPFVESEPPVIVDWLPWSHTFGANHNLNMVMRNGGALYIDAGRPAPGLIDVTAANIKDVGPNMCFNVPRGYAMLADALEQDAELRQRFFANVRLIFYAAAALPQNIWDQLIDLSRRATGAAVPMVSAWGSTETAPMATDCHFQAERSGNIGVPVPGVELKLVPNAGKMEIRVRGPNVTPGYFRQPELTRAAFDEEGFYCIGDAVRLADEADASKGLFFDGRVAEDFKLSTGTFVHVGQLRIAGIEALAPVAQDIVLTGHDRDAVGFLVFPNVAAARAIAGAGEEAPLRAVLDDARVRAHVASGLARLKAAGGGSSRYAARARLMEAPPSVDAGEINDKGYINQRAVLDNRPDEIAALQGDDPAQFIEPG